MRDSYGSPPRTGDSSASFSQADRFLLTPNRRGFGTEYPSWSSSPSTIEFQLSDKPQPLHAEPSDAWYELPRSKPLFRGFERPSFTHIVVLTGLCLIAYPALYILTLVAKDKSLFTVRLIVAMWCSGVGFALGYVLMRIGMQHLEAASEFLRHLAFHFLRFCPAWATVIHMSYDGGGMKLSDLAKSSRNPTSFLPALRILLSRFRSQDTSRDTRKSYECVFRDPPIPHHLTFPQQTTMVPVRSVLHRPRSSWTPVAFPVRTDYGNPNLRPRTSTTSFFSAIFSFPHRTNVWYTAKF